MGACIFMSGFLKANNIQDRTVWVADSFQGLPPPDNNDFSSTVTNYSPILPFQNPFKTRLIAEVLFVLLETDLALAESVFH